MSAYMLWWLLTKHLLRGFGSRPAVVYHNDVPDDELSDRLYRTDWAVRDVECGAPRGAGGPVILDVFPINRLTPVDP